ncbi:radical SAM/SPASM domain-containing protein [Selenomonas sp. KH1T6]|uniref:radical SAM/SPASM domain-containing protein n=1 Tax=Selenomonas sp. KH1T6 TaxID=3158784 RepID=UPI0008A7530B|nr:uncharacterized protein SAMN05216583_1423 [Selenomonas ruminantium]
MKLSKYNFFKKYDNSTVYFNAATCALAIVDECFLRVVDDIKNNCFDEAKYDSRLVNDMKISGCIVNDDVDELERLQFYRNLTKYDATNLSLTIAPTLDCNFRCKYCFETHPKGIMSSDIQAALLKFVEKHLEGVKKFSVTWYGGEPLLAKSVVYSLSEKFLELCVKRNIKYDAFIITNASLIDALDIEKFKKYKINRVQVTIDGPKEIHDQRRRCITRESTYDKLIENVNSLLNNDLSVAIRINIDKENISNVDELLQDLSRRIDRYKNLNIGFGKVSPFTEICKSIEEDCYSYEQFADVMLSLYGKVADYGLKVSRKLIYPIVRMNYCGCADCVNSFVVDNSGSLYKCWNDVGNEKNSCGNVNDFRIEGNYMNSIQWNPIRIDKCRECQYLPVCMGGCPSAAKQAGEPVCGTIKYNLDRVLEYYYYKLRR